MSRRDVRRAPKDRRGRPAAAPQTPRRRVKWGELVRALHAPAEVTVSEARLFTWGALGAIALFLIAALWMALGPHRIGDYFTETDFYGAYADGARAIQGGAINPGRYGVVGPLYEITLAGVGFLVRDLFLAAELLSVLAMSAALWLWFELLRRRTDVRLATFATLLVAANPTFLRYAYTASTDALAVAIQAAALWALFADPNGGRWRLGLAGLLSGLAFLTRYTAIYLLPAGLIAQWLDASPHRARRALWVAAGFAAPVAPWVLYSLSQGGRLEFQLHHNIAYDVFARSQGMVWDDYQEHLQPQFKNLWDVIAKDPWAVLTREAFNVWDHLRQDAFTLLRWPVALAALIGASFAWTDGTLRRTAALWIAAGLLFLALVPAFSSDRYSLSLLPFYAALAAAAFASPRFAAPLGKSGLRVKSALLVIPLGLSIQASFQAQSKLIYQLPVEALQAAETLKRLARPGDRLIARKPHVAYHAGVEMAPFPFTRSLSELAAYAGQRGARWLYFSWPEAQLRPDFWYLLDTAGAVPGLTPRFANPSRASVLYEIGPGFGTDPPWFANDTLFAQHNARGRLMVNPTDSLALYALAYIERARGHLPQARVHLETATAHRPRSLDLLLALGEVCLTQQDGTRAAQVFDQAMRVAPRNVRARVGRGWASILLGQEQEAADLWRPVIRHTYDPPTLERMAQVFQRTGDAKSAAEAEAQLQVPVGGGGRE